MAKISDLLTTEPQVKNTSLVTYALAAMLRKLPWSLLVLLATSFLSRYPKEVKAGSCHDAAKIYWALGVLVPSFP